MKIHNYYLVAATVSSLAAKFDYTTDDMGGFNENEDISYSTLPNSGGMMLVEVLLDSELNAQFAEEGEMTKKQADDIIKSLNEQNILTEREVLVYRNGGTDAVITENRSGTETLVFSKELTKETGFSEDHFCLSLDPTLVEASSSMEDMPAGKHQLARVSTFETDAEADCGDDFNYDLIDSMIMAYDTNNDFVSTVLKGSELTQQEEGMTPMLYIESERDMIAHLVASKDGEIYKHSYML